MSYYDCLFFRLRLRRHSRVLRVVIEMHLRRLRRWGGYAKFLGRRRWELRCVVGGREGVRR